MSDGAFGLASAVPGHRLMLSERRTIIIRSDGGVNPADDDWTVRP